MRRSYALVSEPSACCTHAEHIRCSLEIGGWAVRFAGANVYIGYGQQPGLRAGDLCERSCSAVPAVAPIAISCCCTMVSASIPPIIDDLPCDVIKPLVLLLLGHAALHSVSQALAQAAYINRMDYVTEGRFPLMPGVLQ